MIPVGWIAAARAEPDPLFDRLTVVLDDARSREDRRAALRGVGDQGDPRAFPFLAAQAERPDAGLGPDLARAALAIPHPGGADIAARVLRTDGLPRADGAVVVALLAEAPGDEAGDALWGVVGDRRIPARLRRAAVDALVDRHPDAVDRNGPPPTVPELPGTALTLASTATAGGVILGSVGALGAWEGGPTVGAVGGAALGAGLGGVWLLDRPVSTADGLALASGVAWGVTSGVWAGNAVWGAQQYTWPSRPDDRRLRSGVRAVGTLTGTIAGAWASTRGASPGDVLEVNTAGYLTQAAIGGFVLLATAEPPATTFPTSSTGTTRVDPYEAARRDSRRYATAELFGAVAGLGAGAVLAPRWELGWDDAAFAAVVGAEGAALGATLPYALGGDGSRRGTFWFPSHAGALAGLAIAEVLPSDTGRTLATAFGAGVGNAAGAGFQLLAGYDSDRDIALGAAPAGFVGTVAGWVAEPLLHPSAGDAAMIGVATGIVGTAGGFVGQGLAAGGRWRDPAQGTGLGLTAAGLAGVATWSLIPITEARVDEALFVGSTAALGSLLGGLGTYAVGASGETAWYAAAGSELAGTALGAALVSEPVGFEPRRALVPEVGAVTGATLGALGAALATDDSRAIAVGTVAGATVGLGAGVGIELLRRPKPRGDVSWHLPSLPMPSVSVSTSPDGTWLGVVSARGW